MRIDPYRLTYEKLEFVLQACLQNQLCVRTNTLQNHRSSSAWTHEVCCKVFFKGISFFWVQKKGRQALVCLDRCVQGCCPQTAEDIWPLKRTKFGFAIKEQATSWRGRCTDFLRKCRHIVSSKEQRSREEGRGCSVRSKHYLPINFVIKAPQPVINESLYNLHLDDKKQILYFMSLLFFSSASLLHAKKNPNQNLSKYTCSMDFTVSKEESQGRICIAREGSALRKRK